jgi:hypothetical protein
MSKTLDHRFRSSKADGPDPTQVQPSAWNDGHQFTGGANGNVLIRDTADPAYGATWYPLGEWASIPFNAANFRGNLNMTWTVNALDYMQYAVIGKTMFLAWGISNSVLSGPADTAVVMVLPAGVPTPAGAEISVCRLTAGGTTQMGLVYIQPGLPYINIALLGQTALPAGGFVTQGQVFFKVA